MEEKGPWPAARGKGDPLRGPAVGRMRLKAAGSARQGAVWGGPAITHPCEPGSGRGGPPRGHQVPPPVEGKPCAGCETDSQRHRIRPQGAGVRRGQGRCDLVQMGPESGQKPSHIVSVASAGTRQSSMRYLVATAVPSKASATHRGGQVKPESEDRVRSSFPPVSTECPPAICQTLPSPSTPVPPLAA